MAFEVVGLCHCFEVKETHGGEDEIVILPIAILREMLI
jgi:hypothetical protein